MMYAILLMTFMRVKEPWSRGRGHAMTVACLLVHGMLGRAAYHLKGPQISQNSQQSVDCCPWAAGWYSQNPVHHLFLPVACTNGGEAFPRMISGRLSPARTQRSLTIIAAWAKLVRHC